MAGARQGNRRANTLGTGLHKGTREWLGLMIWGRASALTGEDDNRSGDMTVQEQAIDSEYTWAEDIRYRVDVLPDPHARPQDDPGYTAEDLIDWQLGHWQYVIVRVTPLISAVTGEHVSAEMGKVKFGSHPGFREPITISSLVAEFPVPKLVESVRKNLADLRERLSSLDLGTGHVGKHRSGEYKILP